MEIQFCLTFIIFVKSFFYTGNFMNKILCRFAFFFLIIISKLFFFLPTRPPLSFYCKRFCFVLFSFYFFIFIFFFKQKKEREKERESSQIFISISIFSRQDFHTLHMFQFLRNKQHKKKIMRKKNRRKVNFLSRIKFKKKIIKCFYSLSEEKLN